MPDMKLIFRSGPLEGKKYAVDDAVTLGRGDTNDIIISEPGVSVVHCQIYFDGDKHFIKDLGSTNGVQVNGERVVSSELYDGDNLVIGTSRIKVSLPEEPDTTEVATTKEEPQLKTIFDTAGMLPEDTVHEYAKDELSGNIFGQVTYFLKRRIASGGMGSIYEAEQFGAEGFIKKVAIKTILPSFAKRTDFVSSFVAEAKLVANLVHQNIVQIHHLGRHEDGYYIAMEYIAGVNLSSFINAHRILHDKVPVDIATFIVSRICRGLEYAHNKVDEAGDSLGLVHRDVSPNNIMLTTEGEVKLTDFGVAKARQFMELEEEGYLVGSVEYMSPEQAACEQVDHRSDIYSMGLVFYELLTGVRVFQCRDGDIDETVERVMEGKVPDPAQYRSMPANIKRILMQCLEKDPSSRFQSAGDLGTALEHSMYSKGYGPTILTLSSYLEEMEKKNVGN